MSSIASVNWLYLFRSVFLTGIVAVLPLFVWLFFGGQFRYRLRVICVAFFAVQLCALLTILLDSLDSSFLQHFESSVRIGPSPQSWGFFFSIVLVLSSVLLVFWCGANFSRVWRRKRSASFIAGLCVSIVAVVYFTGFSHEDTEAAQNYSARNFDSICVGATVVDVYKALGVPLRIQTNEFQQKYLVYSDASSAGWVAKITVCDGRVIDKYRSWKD